MHVSDVPSYLYNRKIEKIYLINNMLHLILMDIVFILLQLGSVWIPTQNGTFDLGSGWISGLTLKADLCSQWICRKLRRVDLWSTDPGSRSMDKVPGSIFGNHGHVWWSDDYWPCELSLNGTSCISSAAACSHHELSELMMKLRRTTSQQSDSAYQQVRFSLKTTKQMQKWIRKS